MCSRSSKFNSFKLFTIETRGKILRTEIFCGSVDVDELSQSRNITNVLVSFHVKFGYYKFDIKYEKENGH